jgi:hypothetical protein
LASRGIRDHARTIHVSRHCGYHTRSLWLRLSSVSRGCAAPAESFVQPDAVLDKAKPNAYRLLSEVTSGQLRVAGICGTDGKLKERLWLPPPKVVAEGWKVPECLSPGGGWKSLPGTWGLYSLPAGSPAGSPGTYLGKYASYTLTCTLEGQSPTSFAMVG